MSSAPATHGREAHSIRNVSHGLWTGEYAEYEIKYLNWSAILLCLCEFDCPLAYI